jgi:2-haloalkanoic acid dehalogenase type II
MPVKAVLFDMGLTLTKTSPFPEIYRRILAHFKIKVSVEDVVGAQKTTETKFDAADYPINRRKEYWTEYNVSLLEKLGIQDKRVFLAEKIDELWWEYSHLKVYQDVEPTLSRLRAKGLKVGIVSNGLKKDLEHVLEKLKLKKWFDVVVSLDSCNCAKPDKEIFLFALNKLGVQPSEVVFVGDSVENDYEGALNIGIKSLIIDREGKVPNQYNKITSLTDLLTIV